MREKIRIDATCATFSAEAGVKNKIDLPPGRYTLVLRYYGWNGEPRLPAIEVDGVQVVDTTPLSPDTNDFYNNLSARTGFYYLCLHFDVSVIPRYRQNLPAGFVRREYLPVGNPESSFFYGPLESGQRLSVASVLPLLPDYRLDFTVYNRASFPVFWCSVDGSAAECDAVKGGAHYLIRAHGKVSALGAS